ncbi:3-deoxy-D-manno-octulosonic acid transferase [Thalassococcus sp. S3]|uniref:3-deoxy-D-manno-octulosonic acid transferase n=1 Tax=Thalassococcus sp. S3 TaxID=2017482 RepID=UPI0010244522|nr:glycosyltransferase N-terminal domain-containing protein [Thalassococcus sp. S3]QBF33810.1 3-deoxy-D-manno-octulosonic acid transferase [Thalassococcus sp. S3]
MARSLSLAAYRALSARKPQATFAPPVDRPEGEVLWAHATSSMRLAALQNFGFRLKQQRPDLHVLITTSQRTGPGEELWQGADWICPLVPDHPELARAFLDHWRPDLGVWTGGYLQPNLISTARERDLPMVLIDADNEGFDEARHSWFPSLIRSCLGCFETILSADEATAERLIRLGAKAEKVTVSARLRNGSMPVAINETDLKEVTDMLGGRPIWLAAHVQPDEVETVLAAHRHAIRLAHRLLLVLLPASPDQADAYRTMLEQAGMRWSDCDTTDDSTQVLLCDTECGLDEIALWYRVAPLSLVGSSLKPGYGGHDPFMAAAFGSAILYGPNVRNHLSAYSRLASAGAARIVKDADTLSAAVSRLIAPDQAASMALAGWEVVSEGAHLTDQLLELAHDTLDHAGPH